LELVDDIKEEMMATQEKIFSAPPVTLSKFKISKIYQTD
jgi:hypothetical protein